MLLGLIGLALWWIGRGPAASLEDASSPHPGSSHAGVAGRGRSEEDGRTEGREEPEHTDRTGTLEGDRALRRAVARGLRESIARARTARAGASTEPASGPQDPSEDRAPAGAPGQIDPQYVQDAVRELIPLLAECYEMLEQASDAAGEPAPEGRLVARFVFSGEPEVGGVVEESEILDESTLRSPLLEECFAETLYTLELPAPEAGGTVTVHYPFELSRGEDE